MNIGGSIRRPVCFFRWDLYPYLSAFDNITSQPPQRPQSPQLPQGSQPMLPTLNPPPPPDGKTISTGIIVAIVVSLVLFVALLALGLVFWKRRQYRTTKLESELLFTLVVLLCHFETEDI